MMYHEETGAGTLLFGHEMAYETATLYMVTEEMLYVVLHLPLLDQASRRDKTV